MSQLENIKSLHNQGDYQQAIEGYQALLAEEPNNDEIHFGLAHASSRLNQLDTALKHAREAVNLVPNSDRYLQFKAQMLMANNEIDEALKTFKRSLKENPNLFYSYLAIGDIHAMRNQSSKAKDNYRLALKVQQQGIPAITKLAKLMMLESDFSAATDELQQAELQFPTDPELKLHSGILRLEQGEDGFAELYFKQLLDSEPGHVLAKIYLAISLINSDPKAATQMIEQLVKDQIQRPELMVALGLLYAKDNNPVEAIKFLKPVCQSGLAYPSWLLALAHAFSANNQPNSSMAVINEVLKRGDNPRALLMLAQIHQVNDNLPAALRTLKRIGKDSPGYAQSLQLRAECAFMQDQYAEAISLCDDLLQLQSDHNGALKLKLNALSKLEQYDEALAVIASINSEQQSEDFNQLMHFYGGLLQDANGSYADAWEHFKKLDPKPRFEAPMLSASEEKVTQNWPSPPTNSVFRFAFTDPATGHHHLVNWLEANQIAPLTDRFTKQARADLFTREWTVDMLDQLTDEQIHLLRKKYTKYLQQVVDDGVEQAVDFMPFSPINVAVIRRLFPQAHVIILNRNFADLRLHNQVFGSYQVHYSQFSKVTNQMIGLNPNVTMIDIDGWHSGDESAIKSVEKVFGPTSEPFVIGETKPLDRLLFPYMHWKKYQQYLNQ
ncbi:tetratricopeptide repeat protein [Marinicella sediminis]|uniref:Tetratricopeptide repeat protein n=1 Tax=Marinicella sediminis TaxID=1792834 RepID=A0ABV7J6W1_9GAMM|nr:tetratricopeptide repeat protein [Marinicella sediminis]